MDMLAIVRRDIVIDSVWLRVWKKEKQLYFLERQRLLRFFWPLLPVSI